MSATTLAAHRGRFLGSAVVTWLVLAAALVLWELIAIGADSVYFPRMTAILATGADLLLSGPAWRLMLGDAVFDVVLPSLATALGAWALSAALGVALGTALGRSRWAMDYCGTLISFLRSVPPVALMPAFMVVFGIGVEMEIAAIVFSTLWPIVLNTVDGVRSVDDVKIDTARSLGTPRRYWLGMIVLPAAMPKIFAGLRLSLSIAILLMVVAEIVAGTGIGLRLTTTQSTAHYTEMWLWVLLLGVLGYALNSALLAVERLVLGWQPARGDDA